MLTPTHSQSIPTRYRLQQDVSILPHIILQQALLTPTRDLVPITRDRMPADMPTTCRRNLCRNRLQHLRSHQPELQLHLCQWPTAQLLRILPDNALLHLHTIQHRLRNQLRFRQHLCFSLQSGPPMRCSKPYTSEHLYNLHNDSHS